MWGAWVWGGVGMRGLGDGLHLCTLTRRGPLWGRGLRGGPWRWGKGRADGEQGGGVACLCLLGLGGWTTGAQTGSGMRVPQEQDILWPLSSTDASRLPARGLLDRKSVV